MGSLKRSLANNILTSGKFDATDLTGNLPSSNIANESMTSITAFPASAGSAIALVASDPPAPTVGDVWFNTTSNALKYAGAGVGSWATGGNMGTARYFLGSAGTQTAALGFGGYNSGNTGVTEEYDGSTWTSNPTGLNTVRRALGGAGTQTAALGFGGVTSTALTGATEEYDGSTWTSNPTGLNTARYSLAGCGIQTAALAFGGYDPVDAVSAVTEEYDGSTWTSNPTGLNTARASLAGCGTQTAGLALGGESATALTGATEEWLGAGSPQTKTITAS